MKGREELFRTITAVATPAQKALADKRAGYKMPPGYISKRALVEIDLGCLILSDQLPDLLAGDSPHNSSSSKSSDSFGSAFNMWADTNSPLYCVTQSMMEALNFTDSLSKKEILENFNLPLKDMMVALPKCSLHCPASESGNEAYIDFLLVNCGHRIGRLNNISIGVFTIDTDGDSWVVSTEIDASGAIVYNQSAYEERHKEFFDKIRNLTVSVLLLLNTSPDSIVSDVLPAETIEDYEKPKGFGKIRSALPPKYPRWIGKNYQIKSQRRQASRRGGTHASPRAHWRCGHFRRLEPGEGKRWTEQKTLWIEPVFILRA